MKIYRTRHTDSGRAYRASFFQLISIYLVIGFITRIALLLNPQTQIGFTAGEWIGIFALGAINDFCLAVVGYSIYWLFFVFLTEAKYQKPWGYLIEGLLLSAFVYVAFFNTIFDEYGSAVPKIAKAILAFKLISFSIRLFVPLVREAWSRAVYAVITFLFVSVLLVNAVGEFYFWNEFGVRYNFIAVDYLVYTNEVIGDIMESYPIVPLFAGLALVAGFITFYLVRPLLHEFKQAPSASTKASYSIAYFALAGASVFALNFNVRFQNSENIFANELQANGAYKFYNAFQTSELKYTDFYTTLPHSKAVSLINAQYNSKGKDNLQEIKDSLPENRKNIVLITVESLSASFLTKYGNKQHITPNLDKLMEESLVFDNLFAVGNRTVRGLEAVTLCLPPSAGESVIKQPDNGGLFSTGKILKEKGYTVQFLYGGYGYFDNMDTFFSGNGYQVIDRKKFKKGEVSFANVWGSCDEDIFAKAMQVFSENAKSGKPFFGHIMTVSNHRPFTYPEGKIDISGKIKSREGGVKYTDYAIGKFISSARKQAWFDNTIFIITADHCASSAGKTEIPLDKYHIPAMIYAPSYIRPAKVNTLMSQIDLMPTVFGLLHFSYRSQFYGKDVFSSEYKPRAFAATYQNLGYYEGNTLTVLSPVRKVEQFDVTPAAGGTYTLSEKVGQDRVQADKAVANYQTRADLLEYRKQKR